MKKFVLLIGLLLLLVGCKSEMKFQAINYQEDKLVKEIDEMLEPYNKDRLKEVYLLVERKSLSEIREILETDYFTYEELAAAYLLQIAERDQKEGGLNSVCEINKNVLKEAKALDGSNNEMLLYGIPILVKDNIAVKDMHNTGGSAANLDKVMTEDSEIIRELKRKGALILGKANMTEWANFTSSKLPEGYSSAYGQTLNPLDKEMTPAASSSGSAVAVKGGFAPIALGTETAGSIIEPARMSKVYGIKPSHSLFSTEGVLPLSPSLDTVGFIGNNIDDLIIVYKILLGLEKANRISIEPKNIKIGLWSKDKKFLEKYKTELENKDFQVVILEDVEGFDSFDIIELVKKEFGPAYEDYAKKYAYPHKTLTDVVKWNENSERGNKYGQDLLEAAAKGESKMENPEKEIEDLRQKFDKLFKEKDIDYIIYPNGEKVEFSAGAGLPELSIPVESEEKEPQSITLISKKGMDLNLLEVGRIIAGEEK